MAYLLERHGKWAIPHYLGRIDPPFCYFLCRNTKIVFQTSHTSFLDFHRFAPCNLKFYFNIPSRIFEICLSFPNVKKPKKSYFVFASFLEAFGLLVVV